jgi:hypothetical protein
LLVVQGRADGAPTEARAAGWVAMAVMLVGVRAGITVHQVRQVRTGQLAVPVVRVVGVEGSSRSTSIHFKELGRFSVPVQAAHQAAPVVLAELVAQAARERTLGEPGCLAPTTVAVVVAAADAVATGSAAHLAVAVALEAQYSYGPRSTLSKELRMYPAAEAEVGESAV